MSAQEGAAQAQSQTIVWGKNWGKRHQRAGFQMDGSEHGEVPPIEDDISTGTVTQTQSMPKTVVHRCFYVDSLESDR